MSPTLLQAVVRVADARTSDAELLARFARDRDEAAFEELVRRHGALVWAVCRQLLPHHADAEDAFQAVFLALVRGAGGVRSGQALAAWLHGVAVRVATKSKRTAARRRQREERVALPEADRPVPDAAWAALMTAVHEEVRQLPEAERIAFVLCELEGVRQPDAATRLGWPLGTLSGRLCKARQRLIEMLSRRGIAPGVLVVGGVGASGGAAPAALVNKVISFPSATAGGIPSTVAELARGLAEGVAMRTKLMAAAVLVAGAMGITGGAMILSKADAQMGGGSGSSAGGPPGGLPPGAAQPGAPIGPPGGGIGDLPPGATGGGMGGVGLPPLPVGGRPPVGGPGLPGTGPVGPGGMPGMGSGMMGGTGPGHRPWEYKFVDEKMGDRDWFEKTLTQNGNDGWEYVGSESLSRRNDAGKLVLVFKRPKGGVVGGTMGGGGGGMRPPGGAGGGRGGSGGADTGGPGGFGSGGGEGGFDPNAPRGGGRGGSSDGPMGSGTAPRTGRTDPEVYEVVKLKNANADDVAKSIEKTYAASKLRAVAERSSNSVIIIAVDPAKLKDVKKTIADLDAKASVRPPTPGSSGAGDSYPGGSTDPSSGSLSGGGGAPGGLLGGGTSGPPRGMVSGGPMPGGGGALVKDGLFLNVFSLRNAQAVDMATLLKQVFPQTDFTADPRTNSIICRADQETLEVARALISKLDVEVPSPPKRP